MATFPSPVLIIKAKCRLSLDIEAAEEAVLMGIIAVVIVIVGPIVVVERERRHHVGIRVSEEGVLKKKVTHHRCRLDADSEWKEKRVRVRFVGRIQKSRGGKTDRGGEMNKSACLLG
jgi:hypothetical protein